MVSKVVPAPHVWMVAVPETAGVHWKTRSGEVPELPQLPASVLLPLVVPLKVPPCAGMTVGLLQLSGNVVVVVPPVEVLVVVVVLGEVVVVLVGAPGLSRSRASKLPRPVTRS